MKTPRGDIRFLIVITLLTLAAIILWLTDPSNHAAPNYRVGWPSVSAPQNPPK